MLIVIPTKIHCIFALLIVLSGALDWTPVEDKINYYLNNGAFVGGILRVSNGTHTLYNNAFGYLTHPNLPYNNAPFLNETIFDLASVTKVTATLSCIMHLYDQGKLDVNDLITKYVPEYGNHNKSSTTLKNFLLHNAGLLPDYPSPLPKTKKQVMDWVFNCSLDYPIGQKYVYSDLSFIMLAEIAERITGKPLETIAK